MAGGNGKTKDKTGKVIKTKTTTVKKKKSKK